MFLLILQDINKLAKQHFVTKMLPLTFFIQISLTTLIHIADTKICSTCYSINKYRVDYSVK